MTTEDSLKTLTPDGHALEFYHVSGLMNTGLDILFNQGELYTVNSHHLVSYTEMPCKPNEEILNY